MAFFNDKDEVECPFCKTINSQDEWYPDQDESREIECEECEKTFTVYATYSIHLTTYCGGENEKACEWERYIIGEDSRTNDGKVYVKCKNCEETQFMHENNI